MEPRDGETQALPFVPLSERGYYVAPFWLAVAFFAFLCGVAVAVLLHRLTRQRKRIVEGESLLGEGYVYGQEDENELVGGGGYHEPTPDLAHQLPRGEPLPEPEAAQGTQILRPGHHVRLAFAAEGAALQVLVIHADARYFVTTLPARDLADPKAGDTVRGFVALDQVLMNFETTVERVLEGVIRGCVLEQRTEMAVASVRSSPRIPVNQTLHFLYCGEPPRDPEGLTPMEVQTWFGKEEIDGALIDISMGGCAMEAYSPYRFQPGGLVSFYFRVDKTEPEINLLGRVRFSKALPMHRGRGRALHVEFMLLDDRASDSLRRTLLGMMRRDGGATNGAAGSPKGPAFLD